MHNLIVKHLRIMIVSILVHIIPVVKIIVKSTSTETKKDEMFSTDEIPDKN